MKKRRVFLKRWGFAILMGLSLIAWGIITGNWGMVFFSAYLLGSFMVWVQKQVKLSTIIIFVMLPAIADKVKGLQQWGNDAERHVITEAQAFEAEILDYNTEEQLYIKGQAADGQRIAPPYHPLTIEIKRAQGQPTNRVTLRDTGDFHSSFYVEWRGREFEVKASDGKTPKLIRDYGPEILGLDTMGLDELADNIREPLIDNLRKAVL